MVWCRDQNHYRRLFLRRKARFLTQSSALCYAQRPHPILAKQIGIQFPTGFRVFRLLKYPKFVEEVVNAWRDKDDPELMFICHHVLASWGMDPDSLIGCFKKANDYVVVHEALVPCENTLADKWVDDGSFIIPWATQKEVVVGIDVPDTLAVLRRNAVVFYKGQRYTFDRRAELIARWDREK